MTYSIIKKVLLGVSLCFALHAEAEDFPQRLVTYQTTSGRFGDNLLSYIHAKYFSFIQDIPLAYKPFVYSDQLKLSRIERRYTAEIARKYRSKITLSSKRALPTRYRKLTLFTMPYFPDSQWERNNCLAYSGGKWDCLPMDWSNKAFVEELNRMIAPNETFEFPEKPADRISVAVHVRRGGNHDGSKYYLQGEFPLKFVPSSVVIEELREVHKLLDKAPLYVYIFTDDNYPPQVMREFARAFKSDDIQFDCRRSKNSDTRNVVYDFFHMMEFDCLIHSESNYSYLPSRLKQYKISICPDSVSGGKRNRKYKSFRVVNNLNKFGASE